MKLSFLLLLLFFSFPAMSQGEINRNNIVLYCGAGSVINSPLPSGAPIIHNMKFKSIGELQLSMGAEYHNRSLKNFVPAINVFFSTFEYRGSGKDYMPTTATWYYTLKGYTTSINPSLLYYFLNKKDIRLLAGAGLGINISHYTNKDIKLVFNNVASIDNTDYKYRQPWLTGSVNTGLIFKSRYGLNVHAGYGEITKEADFSIKVFYYGLSFRYYLSL